MATILKNRLNNPLTLLIGSLFFVGLVVISGLILLFSPISCKKLHLTLIAPKELSLSNLNIQWVVYKPEQARFTRMEISKTGYEVFFSHIAHLRSQVEPGEEVVNDFALNPLSTLSIVSDGQAWQVQFLQKRDIFRILGPKQNQWVYFQSPAIFDHTMKLLGA